MNRKYSFPQTLALTVLGGGVLAAGFYSTRNVTRGAVKDLPSAALRHVDHAAEAGALIMWTSHGADGAGHYEVIRSGGPSGEEPRIIATIPSESGSSAPPYYRFRDSEPAGDGFAYDVRFVTGEGSRPVSFIVLSDEIRVQGAEERGE